MSKEPKLCVLGVLGGKENFEAIALVSHRLAFTHSVGLARRLISPNRRRAML